MTTSSYHEPVLGPETLDFLHPAGSGIFLDGTVGGGGHAELILSTCPECRLIAVDRDPEALTEAEQRLAPFRDRVQFVRARYDESLEAAGVGSGTLSGALLDLGVSSRQLDADARGFTFRTGASLDMRFDQGESGETAAEILNTAPLERLESIFRTLAEMKRPGRLARGIVRRRERAPLETSDDLVAALSVALNRSPTQAEKAKLFQGLRLEVNSEVESLEMGLELIRDALEVGGVIVVIAYMSTDDRRVKHAFREWSRSCICPPRFPVCACRGRALGETLTRKVVRPGAEELGRNPRSRSARLRAWRKAA